MRPQLGDGLGNSWRWTRSTWLPLGHRPWNLQICFRPKLLKIWSTCTCHRSTTDHLPKILLQFSLMVPNLAGCVFANVPIQFQKGFHSFFDLFTGEKRSWCPLSKSSTYMGYSLKARIWGIVILLAQHGCMEGLASNKPSSTLQSLGAPWLRGGWCMAQWPLGPISHWCSGDLEPFFLVRENKCQLYVNLFPWSCSLQEGTTALVAGAERRFISGRYEGVGVLGVKSFLPIVGAQVFWWATIFRLPTTHIRKRDAT